jgi:hypothetical protein
MGKRLYGQIFRSGCQTEAWLLLKSIHGLPTLTTATTNIPLKTHFTLIILITGRETGKVSDILDYDYVKHLENNENILIRHTKQQDDVLTESDMTAAGVMLQQMWIVGDTREDVIRKEHEVRAKIYRQPQKDCVYSSCWDAKD